jgi:signal peptide peptidase SppA
MPLSELLSADLWAVTPQALETFVQTLLSATFSGAEQAQPLSPYTESRVSLPPDSDDRLVGYTLQGGVAIIPIHGIVSRRSGKISMFGWNITWMGQDSIRDAIADAVANPAVRAILLSFDSPGSVAQGAKELADFISAQAKEKPIYAYADGTCASAAYWWAAATGKVYAPACAVVGSIGVISAHIDRSALNAAIGIRITYITGGTWKATGNPDTPLSAADQAYLQERVSAIHEIFRTDIATRMPVDASASQLWGDGQIFLAEKALGLGLISGIVTDRDELVARINKEISMDKDELAQKHPELFAQIQAEAQELAEKVFSEAHEAQLAAAALVTAALVTAVAGKEAAEIVAKLAASGVTAEQLEAIAPILSASASGNAEAGNKGSDSRAEILAALRDASLPPINTQVAPKNDDPVMAAITRISAISV